MTDALRDQLQRSLGQAYSLERELGGGGMSRVFVATDAALERRIVVKVLAPELAQGLSAERFAREVRLAARLQHPNIVPVLAAGTGPDGLPYYTMPFIDGATLRERVAAGPLPVVDAVGVLRDVARALAHAHAQGVVHRDIKPENVLLTGGAAVVTDFGIARALTAAADAGATLTQAGMAVGTPAYMAPEQAVGEASLDHRADLYALGLLGWEMLAGRHPFADRTTAMALVGAHLTQVPAPIAEVRPDAPAALAALLARCLAKDPAARPASASAVLQALDGALLAPAAPAMDATPATAATSIAVLPFQNLSPDPADAYFADGLTDEIITDLSAIQSIRVIASRSVAAYRAAPKEPADVARELGVRWVLDGSVRRAGPSFRLTLRLLDAPAGTLVWSDKLEGTVEDVFRVQEAVSRTVVAALRLRLTPDEETRREESAGRQSVVPAAIEAYLEGRHFYTLATGEAMSRALDCFQRATERDDTFAAAFAGLANTYTFMTISWQAAAPREAMPKAAAAVRRALALDPRLAEAHVARGRIATFHDWDRDAADAAFREAIRLNPSDADARTGYAQSLATVDTRFDEAIAHAAHAVSCSPLDPWAHWYLGFAQYFARDYEARIETMRRRWPCTRTGGTRTSRSGSRSPRPAGPPRRPSPTCAPSRSTGGGRTTSPGSAPATCCAATTRGRARAWRSWRRAGRAGRASGGGRSSSTPRPVAPTR